MNYFHEMGPQQMILKLAWKVWIKWVNEKNEFNLWRIKMKTLLESTNQILVSRSQEMCYVCILDDNKACKIQGEILTSTGI